MLGRPDLDSGSIVARQNGDRALADEVRLEGGSAGSGARLRHRHLVAAGHLAIGANAVASGLADRRPALDRMGLAEEHLEAFRFQESLDSRPLEYGAVRGNDLRRPIRALWQPDAAGTSAENG